MYDVEAVRRDFPILAREVHGRPLVYLDNGASAQKPQAVIDAVTRAYSEEYANVHRGLHYLSNLATEKYEATRGTIARFLGAGSPEEIVFTTGSTMGINLVSYAWAAPRLQAGDEIVLSVMEHHANIVPWHFLRERQGVVLKWVDIEPDGSLDPERGARRHRPAHEARRRHPHVERARHRRRRRGDLRRRARARACRCWSTAARRRCTWPSTCSAHRLRLLRRSPATSSTARPARARSTPGPSGSRRCGRSSAAAT